MSLKSQFLAVSYDGSEWQSSAARQVSDGIRQRNKGSTSSYKVKLPPCPQRVIPCQVNQTHPLQVCLGCCLFTPKCKILLGPYSHTVIRLCLVCFSILFTSYILYVLLRICS